MGLQAPNAGKTQDYIASPLQVRGGDRDDPPAFNGPVYALAEYDGKLYAGGAFTAVGSIEANYIATWDGGGWAAVIDNGVNGVGGPVYALALVVGGLGAGGVFLTAGDETGVGNVALWNGTAWADYDGGVVGAVRTIAQGPGPSPPIDGPMIGGDFLYSSDGVLLARFGLWNTGTGKWQGQDGGFGYNTFATAVHNLKIWVGGLFFHAGDPRISMNSIAELVGGKWVRHAMGLDGVVKALLSNNAGNLYIGGRFIWVFIGLRNACVLEWDGAAWSEIGPTSPFQIVNAMVEDGASLVVGGMLSNVDGLLVNNVAAYNGGAWAAMGDGLNGEVLAVAAYAGGLYAGGWFTSSGSGADRVVCPYIAKWDGAEWSAVE